MWVTTKSPEKWLNMTSNIRFIGIKSKKMAWISLILYGKYFWGHLIQGTSELWLKCHPPPSPHEWRKRILFDFYKITPKTIINSQKYLLLSHVCFIYILYKHNKKYISSSQHKLTKKNSGEITPHMVINLARKMLFYRTY